MSSSTPNPDAGKTAVSILNTILLAICLGVLSWVAYTTHQSATNVAVLVERSSSHNREILELRTRVALIELDLARAGINRSRSN